MLIRENERVSHPKMENSALVSNVLSRLVRKLQHVILKICNTFLLYSCLIFIFQRNVDNSVSNTPLHLLEGAEHVNTHKRTRFSPEVGNLSSSKLFDREVCSWTRTCDFNDLQHDK